MDILNEVQSLINNSERKITQCEPEGIIVDNWIRLLNKPGDGINGVSYEELSRLSVVAIDIIGGIFAMDITRFDPGKKDIWYFAPDTLEWECMEIQYEDFLTWVFRGNTDKFYGAMRWQDWEKDCESVTFYQGILIYPFLWAKECDVETASKKVVPMDEIIQLNFEIRSKISDNDKYIKIDWEE